MAKSLLVRKQEFVREAIYDSAIDLFFRKGFEDTLVEEIAQAAGVSTRSFFRYFATKHDVLGYSVVTLGNALIAGVEACPNDLTSLDMVREIARAGIEFSVSQPRTREIISIVTRSVPARQAQQSGLVEVHRRLSEAFAAKVGSASRNSLKPRMLTRLTLMAVDLTLGSWYEGEFKEWQAALKQVFSQLSRVFCDSNQTPISKEARGNGRKR